MRSAICTDDHGLRQPVRRPLGKVFKLDTTGKETVLHTFSGGADEALARGGLIRIAAGNLYGTISSGAMELKKLGLQSGEVLIALGFLMSTRLQVRKENKVPFREK